MTYRTYQLKISLRHSKPSIWRRIIVPSDIVLSDLHEVFQVVMGWGDSHLHQFVHMKKLYGMIFEDDFGAFEEVIDENSFTLDMLLLKEKDKLVYEYDFGDGWEHDVVLEKILPSSGQVQVACLKGSMCCPPDDCGGIWGYEDKLAIMADPQHPDHEEITEWMGDEFDPEYFDLEVVNAQLTAMFEQGRG